MVQMVQIRTARPASRTYPLDRAKPLARSSLPGSVACFLLRSVVWSPLLADLLWVTAWCRWFKSGQPDNVEDSAAELRVLFVLDARYVLGLSFFCLRLVVWSPLLADSLGGSAVRYTQASPVPPDSTRLAAAPARLATRSRLGPRRPAFAPTPQPRATVTLL